MVKKEFDKNCNMTDEIRPNEELKEKGYLYDSERVFIPYTYKNPNNPDCRDIYLAMTRTCSRKTGVTYWWSKNVEGKMYGIEQFERNKLPFEESDDFIIALEKSGINANLDSNENSYKELFEQIKKDMAQPYSFDLENKTYFDFKIGNFIDVEPSNYPHIAINRGDMRKIVRIAFDIKYLKACADENMVKYDLIPCLLSEDENHEARVYKHCYICESCNPPVKLDQHTLLKRAFNVNDEELDNTITEIGLKPFSTPFWKKQN